MKKPNDPLDEFLAAPEQTRSSEAELKKAKLRKAHADAEEARLLAGKVRDAATDEDILADIVRVAEDPELNPLGCVDRTITRKRYRRLGHYPLEMIQERWGEFNHALEIAGLRDQPGTRAKLAARAQRSRREHAGRYLRRVVMPHCLGSDHVVHRELVGGRLVLSISDTHAGYLDPFTWLAFLRACRDLSPDYIIANGDILEGSEISRYHKIPGRTIPLQVEFDFAREMFRQLREVAPDAEIIWTAGNHGLDRIAMYLTQVAPALSGLRGLRFDKLAGVEEFGVRLAQGGSIVSPEGQEDDGPGLLLHGFYRVHHGTKLGQSPALAELQAAGRSGQSGHVHRAGLAYGTTEAHAGLSWMSTPMGCSPSAGRSYMKGVTTGWQMGFGVCHLLPGERVHQYPVVTDGGRCIVEGYAYTAGDLPAGEPDPTTNWLPELARFI